MTIKSVSDRCNMIYEFFMNQSMSMCERKINIIIARNPQLINSLVRNENHPLIREYSHIPHNIITNCIDLCDGEISLN